MNAGLLNTQIELFSYTMGVDEGFGADYTWTSQGKIWAQVLRPRFATGVMQGSADATMLTQGFNIRPRTIGKGWRVKLAGDMYEVLHIDRSQKDMLTLTTRSVEVQT